MSAGPTERDHRRRARVLAAFRSETLTMEQVRERFGLSRANAAQVLSRLVKDGELERVALGEYRRKEPSDGRKAESP